MVYGYARVSTKLQETDGNSLEAQEEQLRASGVVEIYRDTFTGTKAERPELERLKRKLVAGDKVIVTKLDRLARSTEDGLSLIKGWTEQGISIHVLNMGLIDHTPTGKLILGGLILMKVFEVLKSVAGYSPERWQSFAELVAVAVVLFLFLHFYENMERYR